jgi:sterol desaturase/sphingolipid hydroxylase (fatty acid hydroxylase superfamily)
MFAAVAMSRILQTAITLMLSGMLAEFFGYWLHRLLHSDKICFLSRGHLIHHFLIYGPGRPMRHEHYRDATDNRFSVGNVGLEWLLPAVLLLAVIWGLLLFCGVPVFYQLVALATLTVWPMFMFSYLHDRMHLTNFWMAEHALFRAWFKQARRFHDIHHHSVNSAGRMDANFGIGFFWFDRLFRTIARQHRPFNQKGFEAARNRYGLVASEDRSSSDLTISSNLSGFMK